MKVLEQDEELRGKLEYEADNGIKMYSKFKPEICPGYICVGGINSQYDSDYAIKSFDSINEAKEQLQKIQEAVKEFNQKSRLSIDDELEDVEVVIAE